MQLMHPKQAIPPHHRIQGFSLLELMVVITLVAILAMLGAPSISEWMKNQRIRGNAEALLNGLQTAREEAIRRNRPVSFWLVSDLSESCTLSTSSGSWVVSVQSPVNTCNATPSATDAPLLTTAYAASGNISVTADQNEARFDGTGRLTSGGSTSLSKITIQDPSETEADTSKHTYRTLEIRVQGAGAIRLCDPRVASGDPRSC